MIPTHNNKQLDKLESQEQSYSHHPHHNTNATHTLPHHSFQKKGIKHSEIPHKHLKHTRYSNHNHNQHYKTGVASTQDRCYLCFLVLLVACLAAGICTLALMDKTKAYVGGIFLFMFCVFLLCILSNSCCFHGIPSSYPGWWWNGFSFYPSGVYMPPPPQQVTIIENNNRSHDDDDEADDEEEDDEDENDSHNQRKYSSSSYA